MKRVKTESGSRNIALTWTALLIGLPLDERDQPQLVSPRYFPTPPQVLSKRNDYWRDVPDTMLDFLHKLNDLYYMELSSTSHLSEMGLASRGGMLLGDLPEEAQDRIKSEPVMIAMMTLCAILTEVDHHFGLGHKAKLKEAWTYLGETVPLLRELFDTRHREL